jgi:hypothetical protein
LFLNGDIIELSNRKEMIKVEKERWTIIYPVIVIILGWVAMWVILK